MIVDLDKEGLVRLVMGTAPSYEVMDMVNPIFGKYVGGFHDKWAWNRSELIKFSDEGLWDLYVFCKESWNQE